MRVVQGVIELPQWESAEPATAFIRVEDVSQADGKARRLGQAVVNVTTNDFARGAVAFEVTVQEPKTGAKCGVRVHLDLDRDGVVSQGDYVSVEFIPVLTDHFSQRVRVRLVKV